MLKLEDIRNMDNVDRVEKVAALKKELFTLRVELKLGKLEKHNQIREKKKDVARLLTVISEEKTEDVKSSSESKES